jgi:hypothetical protein
LCEGVVQHRDVIGGGVGSGVAGPQLARHGLAGVREETQQRMKAEAAFVSGRGLFLFRVGGDQRGVEVQDQAGKFSSAGLDGGYALAGLVCKGPRAAAPYSPPEDRVDRAARVLDTMHAGSAFRLDRQTPSTWFIVPAQKALSYFLPASRLISTETARLGPVSKSGVSL